MILDFIKAFFANSLYTGLFGLFLTVISVVAGVVVPRFYNHRSRKSIKAQVLARLGTLDLIFALKVTNNLTGHLIAHATMVVLITIAGLSSGIIIIVVLAVKADVSALLLGALFTFFLISLYNITAEFRRLLHLSGAAFQANSQVEKVRAFYRSSSLQQFLDADDRQEIEKQFEQVAAFAKVLDGESRATLISKWTSTVSEEDPTVALSQIRKELEELSNALKLLARPAPTETHQ